MEWAYVMLRGNMAEFEMNLCYKSNKYATLKVSALS
jgi:hypothetical protein